MKKSILFSLVLICIGLSSCNSCTKSKTTNDPVVYHDYDGVVQDFTAGVSNIQALHRQTLSNLVDTFEWRNSKIIFNDTITIENLDSLHITDINDVFYYLDSIKGPQVQYINSNVKYGVQVPWPISGVWVEDDDLSNTEIKLSAEDVLQRLKEWNGVLPKGSKTLVLRLPVGPKQCNAQWVLGSINAPLFIDAVTGEIRNSNPAFSD